MVDTLKTRIILQEVGQADRKYRRIVANIVAPPSYCGHTIDYITDSKDYDLYAILAIVSSSFTEWRFRLTSTSNHVSVREIGNMLIPRFKIGKSPLLSSSSSDGNKSIQRFLTLAESLKINSIRKELLQSLVSSGKSAFWPLVVHDGFAALGRRLCFLGRLRFNLVKEFLAWLGDFLITEVDKWKRNGVFRVFHTLNFKTFYSICRTNRAIIGLVNWDGREVHKRLSEEFEKALAQLHLALDESNEIEDLIDEVIFTMMDVDPSVQETIRERAGTRQPST
jgi:hypothetical protein